MTAHVALSISPTGADLARRTDVAAQVAAAHADAVDREARFPTEAVGSLRAERLMSILVPADLGGEGGSIVTWSTSAMRSAGPAPRPP
jgi:acyl-CoA dehydrogenase